MGPSVIYYFLKWGIIVSLIIFRSIISISEWLGICVYTWLCLRTKFTECICALKWGILVSPLFYFWSSIIFYWLYSLHSTFNPNTFSFCNYELCLYIHLSTLLSVINLNSKIASFYKILSRILSEVYILHKLSGPKFNLLNTLIFEICFFGPIFCWLSSTS